MASLEQRFNEAAEKIRSGPPGKFFRQTVTVMKKKIDKMPSMPKNKIPSIPPHVAKKMPSIPSHVAKKMPSMPPALAKKSKNIFGRNTNNSGKRGTHKRGEKAGLLEEDRIDAAYARDLGGHDAAPRQNHEHGVPDAVVRGEAVWSAPEQAAQISDGAWEKRGLLGDCSSNEANYEDEQGLRFCDVRSNVSWSDDFFPGREDERSDNESIFGTQSLTVVPIALSHLDGEKGSTYHPSSSSSASVSAVTSLARKKQYDVPLVGSLSSPSSPPPAVEQDLLNLIFTPGNDEDILGLNVPTSPPRFELPEGFEIISSDDPASPCTGGIISSVDPASPCTAGPPADDDIMSSHTSSPRALLPEHMLSSTDHTAADLMKLLQGRSANSINVSSSSGSTAVAADEPILETKSTTDQQEGENTVISTSPISDDTTACLEPHPRAEQESDTKMSPKNDEGIKLCSEGENGPGVNARENECNESFYSLEA